MLADAPAGRFDCDGDVAAVQSREEKPSNAITEKMPTCALMSHARLHRPDLICHTWLCTIMEGSDGSRGEKEAGDGDTPSFVWNFGEVCLMPPSCFLFFF